MRAPLHALARLPVAPEPKRPARRHDRLGPRRHPHQGGLLRPGAAQAPGPVAGRGAAAALGAGGQVRLQCVRRGRRVRDADAGLSFVPAEEAGGGGE